MIMALSVTQANQVNVLLGWLLEIPHAGPESDVLATSQDARFAAMALADAAHRVLYAGTTGAGVMKLWGLRGATVDRSINSEMGKLAAVTAAARRHLGRAEVPMEHAEEDGRRFLKKFRALQRSGEKRPGKRIRG
jgi:hypothetical protein